MEHYRRTIAHGQLVLALVIAAGLFLGLAATSGVALAMSDAGPTAGRATTNTVVVSANPLTTGCNQVTETGLTVGGSISSWVTANVQPSSSVISVWHYDNPSQKYQAAYFNVSAVPVDIMTFPAAIDAYFICVSASANAP